MDLDVIEAFLKVGFSCSLMALALFLCPTIIRRQKILARKHFEFIKFLPVFTHKCLGGSHYTSVWEFGEVSPSNFSALQW